MVCITGPPFGVMFENRQLNTCHVILGRSNLYSGTVHVVYNILPKMKISSLDGRLIQMGNKYP